MKYDLWDLWMMDCDPLMTVSMITGSFGIKILPCLEALLVSFHIVRPIMTIFGECAAFLHNLGMRRSCKYVGKFCWTMLFYLCVVWRDVFIVWCWQYLGIWLRLWCPRLDSQHRQQCWWSHLLTSVQTLRRTSSPIQHHEPGVRVGEVKEERDGGV